MGFAGHQAEKLFQGFHGILIVVVESKGVGQKQVEPDQVREETELAGWSERYGYVKTGEVTDQGLSQTLLGQEAGFQGRDGVFVFPSMNMEGTQSEEGVGETDFGVSGTTGGGLEFGQCCIVLVADHLSKRIHEGALGAAHSEVF